jgi:hypothetical protein
VKESKIDREDVRNMVVKIMMDHINDGMPTGKKPNRKKTGDPEDDKT